MVDLADLGKRRRRGKAKKPAAKKKGRNQGKKKAAKASAKKAENTNTNANNALQNASHAEVDPTSSTGIFSQTFIEKKLTASLIVSLHSMYLDIKDLEKCQARKL